MKLKNYEIFNASQTIVGLSNEKMNGGLSFKMYKLGAVLEPLYKPIAKTFERLDNSTEEGMKEWVEVEDVEQEIQTDITFTVEELSQLTLSPLEIKNLSPFINSEKGE